MQRVQLGRTDLIVSRICFGCWQLSPRFWGEISREEWWKAARTAVDRGINFIDTANAYGDGLAESVLGEFLEQEGLRDETVVATKFYWNINAEPRHPDTPYEYILSECEASLKRLRTDRIDLYQMHAWDPLTRPDEVATAIGRLKEEGKIRWVLTHPAVTCAILGVKKPEHIETILPAAEDALPHADWHAAAGIMDKALREARAAKK